MLLAFLGPNNSLTCLHNLLLLVPPFFRLALIFIEQYALLLLAFTVFISLLGCQAGEFKVDELLAMSEVVLIEHGLDGFEIGDWLPGGISDCPALPLDEILEFASIACIFALGGDEPAVQDRFDNVHEPY